MSTLPDDLVPVLDIVSAIRWLAPLPDDENEEGEENDDTPITAMYEMAEGIPGFRVKCLDVLHQQGADGLNRFILDWCNSNLDFDVDETRYLLHGIPTPTYGFEIQDEEECAKYRTVLNFICNLDDETIADDATEPATYLQPPLPCIDEELGPIKLIDDLGDDPYDDIATWINWHDYNTIGDEDEDSDEEYRKRLEYAAHLQQTNEQEWLYNAIDSMGNTASLICHSLTQLKPNIDPRWKAVGWAIGWLFSVTGNTMADMTWEEAGEMGAPPSWSEWQFIQTVINEAEDIHKQAQEGIKLIQHSHLIRAWLAYNIKKCNSLRKKWSYHAQDHLEEITWPALTIQPAETSPCDAAPI